MGRFELRDGTDVVGDELADTVERWIIRALASVGYSFFVAADFRGQVVQGLLYFGLGCEILFRASRADLLG